MIGQHPYLVHAEGAAPSLLRERQVHAYGENIHAGELGGFFIEALGLGVANRRIERRNDADNPNMLAGVGESHGLQCVIHQRKVGSRIAGLELGSYQRKGIASESGRAWSFHGCLLCAVYSKARVRSEL